MERWKYAAPAWAVLVVAAWTLMSLGQAPSEARPEDDAKPPPAYAPIPEGFDFPAPRAKLQAFADQGNLVGPRRHGWHLWAGLNQTAANGQPVWQTWFSYAQAFSPKPIPNPRSPTSPLVQQDLRTLNRVHSTGDQGNVKSGIPIYNSTCAFTGLRLVNNGDIMVAKMLYDWPAYDHIRDKKLWDPSVLTGQIDPREEGGTSIPDFPYDAVVLKHMEWPIAQEGFTALPVWDNKPVKDANAYNGYETWRRAVAVDPTSASSQQTADVTYLYGVQVQGSDGKPQPLGPFQFLKAPVVPLKQFYYRTIDAETWRTMNPDDKCIINQAARWAYNRDFKPGDHLATVACHVITKEIEDWAMQSFWWHDKPDNGPFAADRPADLPAGAWQNYLQVTSYSMTKPREYDTTPRAAYNPYIELAAEHPIATNCQTCHGRAAWQAPGTKVRTPPNYQNRGAVKQGDFDGVLRLDFLWSVQQGAQANLPASK